MITCKTCRYAIRANEHGSFCRRFPPTVVPVPYQAGGDAQVALENHRPYVGDEDWCGEWKPAGSIPPRTSGV